MKGDFDNRFGRFLISNLDHVGKSEAMKHLVAAQEGCAVVKCEHLYNIDAFEVFAYHPDFMEVARGQMPPSYDVEMETLEDGAVRRVGFVRIKAA